MRNSIKQITIGLVVGFLAVVLLNSFGNVIKIEVVAPEQGYTEIQREQLEVLLDKK